MERNRKETPALQVQKIQMVDHQCIKVPFNFVDPHHFDAGGSGSSSWWTVSVSYISKDFPYYPIPYTIWYWSKVLEFRNNYNWCILYIFDVSCALGLEKRKVPWRRESTETEYSGDDQIEPDFIGGAGPGLTRQKTVMVTRNDRTHNDGISIWER